MQSALMAIVNNTMTLTFLFHWCSGLKGKEVQVELVETRKQTHLRDYHSRTCSSARRKFTVRLKAANQTQLLDHRAIIVHSNGINLIKHFSLSILKNETLFLIMEEWWWETVVNHSLHSNHTRFK